MRIISNSGVTNFLDLNSGTLPAVGHTPARCDDANFGTNTLGYSAIAIDVTMEVGQSTLGYIGHLRKFQGTGNVTTTRVVVTDTLAHTMTNIDNVLHAIDGGDLSVSSDNFKVELANSEIPDPYTLGLLGLGALLLLRRRRA